MTLDLSRYRPLSVPGPDAGGAALGGAEWEGTGFPLLGVQGLTSNHRIFHLLAQELPDHRLVAQDARGRASGFGLTCPDGITTHADDLVRLLDRAGIDKAVVVGHSMGGFIGLRFAQRHPDRVEGLVLVDGGPPVQLPGLLRSSWAVKASFTLKMPKASKRWKDHEEMQAWMASRAAGFDRFDPDFIRWAFDIDLVGPPGAMQLQHDRGQILPDAVECFTARWQAGALRGLQMPTHVVLAEWGAKPGAKPLYKEVPAGDALSPTTTAERVAGVDHVEVLTAAPTLAAITSLVPA